MHANVGCLLRILKLVVTEKEVEVRPIKTKKSHEAFSRCNFVNSKKKIYIYIYIF